MVKWTGPGDLSCPDRVFSCYIYIYILEQRKRIKLWNLKLKLKCKTLKISIFFRFTMPGNVAKTKH